MERVLKGDAKVEFWQQAILAGTHTVANFSTVMVKMTAHIFPTYANCDQRQYMQRYLRKPPDMKVRTFHYQVITAKCLFSLFPS